MLGLYTLALTFDVIAYVETGRVAVLSVCDAGYRCHCKSHEWSIFVTGHYWSEQKTCADALRVDTGQLMLETGNSFGWNLLALINDSLWIPIALTNNMDCQWGWIQSSSVRTGKRKRTDSSASCVATLFYGKNGCSGVAHSCQLLIEVQTKLVQSSKNCNANATRQI